MASSLVNNKYRITRRIGGGSFGEIYMGVGPNNEKVAVKFERHGTRCPQLRHEYKVYRELTNCHGFCSVYHFGTQDNYNVMVMDLLGPSLEDLFNKCSRRFSLKTVLQIADQLLERADTLHSRHLIHRDIKPANFVIGVGENAANVYCVDFGLSKRYRHPKNLHHIPHRDGRSLTGTPRYASINNHLGIEQSRRDDLESIGYVLIYFLKGSLPWQGLKAKNAQKKYRLILEKKQQVSIAQLCQGCPSQFAEFLAYTRSLKFDAKPDIPYLRKLFRDLYQSQGCGSIAKLWDWDSMDADYLSANGSSGNAPSGGPGGGPPPISSGPSGLLGAPRPTTAAAVVGQGGVGMESDRLLNGGGGAPDDLDVDYDMCMADNRPNTAGAMLPGGYALRNAGGANAAGIGASQQQQQQQAGALLWGYSRQQPGVDPSPSSGGGGMIGMKSGGLGPIAGSSGVGGGGGGAGGMQEYGSDGTPAVAGGQRRPHTAHGARAGFPSPSQQMNGGAGVVYGSDAQKQGAGAVYDGEDGDAHVVAGARGMMRYRRNRASTTEGQQQQQLPSQQLPQQGIGYGGGVAGGNNTAPWAMYQAGSGKRDGSGGGGAGGPVNIGASWQGGGYSGSGGGVGAGAVDRPKSANFTGGTSNSGGAGLMTSLTGAGRPSSSAQALGSNTNWSAQQQQQQQQALTAGGGGSNGGGISGTNGNTMSYGSLKNRFLSGATKNNAGAATTTTSGTNHATAANSNANNAGATGKSAKLFSLAR